MLTFYIIGIIYSSKKKTAIDTELIIYLKKNVVLIYKLLLTYKLNMTNKCFYFNIELDFV